MDAIAFTFKDQSTTKMLFGVLIIPLWHDHSRGYTLQHVKLGGFYVLLLSNLILTDTSAFHCRLGSQRDSRD